MTLEKNWKNLREVTNNELEDQAKWKEWAQYIVICNFDGMELCSEKGIGGNRTETQSSSWKYKTTWSHKHENQSVVSGESKQ